MAIKRAFARRAPAQLPPAAHRPSVPAPVGDRRERVAARQPAGARPAAATAAATELELGNELFARVDPHCDGSLTRRKDRYTVQAVRAALAGVGPPIGRHGLASQSAFDVWAAYLLLDVSVAARDRHSRNWAVDEHAAGRSLAPSFDHGNALGFQEPADRHQLLAHDPSARSCRRTHTRTHVERRTAEGETAREVRRALERYITRELDRALTPCQTLTAHRTVKDSRALGARRPLRRLGPFRASLSTHRPLDRRFRFVTRHCCTRVYFAARVLCS